MAKIIFQPTGSVSGIGLNALILELRESLIYPFQFEKDWTTLGDLSVFKVE
jgi:hypothetical protein